MVLFKHIKLQGPLTKFATSTFTEIFKTITRDFYVNRQGRFAFSETPHIAALYIYKNNTIIMNST